jgi:integrase
MKGSFQRRGPNTYYLVVSDGFDADKNRIRYTKTVKTAKPNDDKEAQKLLYQFIDSIEKGQYVSTKYNLKEFLELWEKEYCQLSLSPATIDGYVRTIKNYITPNIGHLKLEKLNALQLQKFINQLYEDSVGDRTVKYSKQILSSALTWGVEMGLAANNPCPKIKLRRIEKDEKTFLEEEQFQKLLVALSNEPIKYQTLTILAVLSGARRGELLALKWSDIDFEKKTMSIKRSVQYLPKVGIFTKEPKTKSSIRTISLPQMAIDYLETYKAHQNEKRLSMGDKWTDKGFIFTNPYGGLLNPSSTINDWFRPFIERNGLPKITFHDLRHFHTSFLLASGLDVKTISKRLGHSSTSMALEVYSHVFKSADAAAADIMDGLMTKKGIDSIAK